MGSSAAAVGVWLALAGAAFADCAPGRVEFRGPAGPIASFGVEVADTPALREKGLMFRSKMSVSAGMLFVYDRPGHPQFWMKNTEIPLDMIFMDSAGRVTRVHENAIPGDLTAIDGGEGAQFVLEIGGGLARPLGIVPGTEMRSDQVAPGAAVWACPQDG